MTRLWALSQSDGSRNLLLILASIVGSFGVMTWWYQYSRLLALIEDDSHRPEDSTMDFANHLAATKECYLFMLVMFLMVVYGFTLPSRHQRHPKFSNAVLFTQDFLLIDWFTVISTKITVSLN